MYARVQRLQGNSFRNQIITSSRIVIKIKEGGERKGEEMEGKEEKEEQEDKEEEEKKAILHLNQDI